MNISEKDFALLQRIQHLQQERRLNLEELAEGVGMTPSALLRRLKTLQDAGWVERRQESSPRGRAVYYVPTPRLSVQWVSPHNGVALSWSMHGEMDWEFPLVSQVPDADARETLRRLLWRLRDKGLVVPDMPPWSDEPEESAGGAALVVYGSAARGTARADSDVDLLVLTARHAAKMADVAADVSLASPRPLQVSFAKPEGLKKISKEILRALAEDGLVVHDSLRAPALWRLVYGGRKA